MTDPATLDAYGVLTEPDTLTIQRLMPGPIERVWSYLTESDLRARWLASGTMELKTGAPFELVWRNDELTDPPGSKPDGFGDEHRMQSRIVAADAPNRLVFTWGEDGEVSIELEERDEEVLLTLVHTRIADRNAKLMIGAGWHMHLDLLVARVSDGTTEPFWDGWLRLRDDYDRRIPA